MPNMTTTSKKSNPNHPQKGSKITVEPIRDLQAIQRIKHRLKDHPRNLCLFVLGINSAFRASDLLAIKAYMVKDLNVQDDLVLRERKTGKIRRVTINQPTLEALRGLLSSYPFKDDDYIFKGRKDVLGVPVVTNLVKHWCKSVGLKGNYGSHTLRKTWGYHQRMTFNAQIPQLMTAFNHASQQQTLCYLCIQPTEIKALYLNSL